MPGLDTTHSREPWNKGELVGQKAPLKVKDIWAIRVRLQMQGRIRDLALLDLGIDSKLRACDLIQLTGGRRTFEQFSSFSAIPSSKARCDISGIEVNDALEIAEQTEI